jgi:ATP/maltotriose-dependent transcriptional regulator MalT
MAVALLSTKLHIPQLRQNAILRPRLANKLVSSIEQAGSFVLLSGPAGFGVLFV